MNTFPLIRTLLASVIAVTTVAANSQAHPTPPLNLNPPVAATSHVDMQYGKLPLSFEPNRGQTDKQVQWLAHGPQYTLFLAGYDAVLELNKATPAKRGETKMPAIESVALRMNLLNANDVKQTSGEQLQPGKANYFTGRDSAKWQREVPMYGQVRLESIYPGVDLLYYGHQGQLEYDFVVAAGADPSMIRMSFDGATPKLATNGDLTLPVNGSKTEISFQKPVVYQVKDGVRQPVDGSFSIAENHQVSFHLGAYDHSRELVIDPTLLFVGTLGTGSVGTVPNGMAVDAAGEIILTGYTRDLDFPVTSGALQTECQTYSAAATGNITRCGPNDGAQTSAFVTKISADGQSLVYSTYLHGGSGQESGQSVVADAAGDAYVLGSTSSNDFPITSTAYEKLCNPYYPTAVETSECDLTTINGYGDGGQSLFIAKLNPTGSAILYGTFFGGTAGVFPVQIALDSSNNIYFVGYTITNAADFYYPQGTNNVAYPVTASAYQPFGIAGGTGTATLSKLSADGQTLLYSTLLGTQTASFTDATEPLALAVGPNGMAYVGGETYSADFPTTAGVVKPACAAEMGTPGSCLSDTAFLSAFDTTKTGTASLVYSTYLGGTEVSIGNATQQAVQGLVADSSNNIYVTGFSSAIDFPTTKGAYQTTCLVNSNSGFCNPNGFVQKINPTGTSYIWSTLYGGDNISQWAVGDAVALDATDRVYIYGQSRFGGGDFVNPVEGYYGGGDKIFVATFSADGSQLLFGTHLASLATAASENDEPVAGGGFALDATGNIYFVGYGADNGTFVSTPGTYVDTAVGAGYRAYFGKISPVLAPDTTTLAISPATTTTGQTVTFTAAVAGISQTTPVPTGTVTLTNTNVTPVATIGTITLGSTGSGTFTSDSLAAGTYSVTATYSADSVYDVSTSTAQTLTITSPATATVTLTAPASANAGATVTLSTTVTGTGGTPTGTVFFKDGTTTLGTEMLASGAASFSTSTLAVGTHSISVSYGGNSVFGAAVSAAQTVTINMVAAPSIAFAANPTTLTVAQGASGTVVITATPTGGYAGGVTFACGMLPADASCSFAPASLTFTSASGAQTSTLTFATTPATSAAITHGPKRSYAPEIFAALLLFPLGFRKRLRKVAASYRFGGGLLLLLFIAIATTGLLTVTGCSSSGNPASTATAAGTYTVPVTVTAGTTMSTLNVTVVVQ